MVPQLIVVPHPPSCKGSNRTLSQASADDFFRPYARLSTHVHSFFSFKLLEASFQSFFVPRDGTLLFPKFRRHTHIRTPPNNRVPPSRELDLPSSFPALLTGNLRVLASWSFIEVGFFGVPPTIRRFFFESYCQLPFPGNFPVCLLEKGVATDNSLLVDAAGIPSPCCSPPCLT